MRCPPQHRWCPECRVGPASLEPGAGGAGIGPGLGSGLGTGLAQRAQHLLQDQSWEGLGHIATGVRGVQKLHFDLYLLKQQEYYYDIDEVVLHLQM